MKLDPVRICIIAIVVLCGVAALYYSFGYFSGISDGSVEITSSIQTHTPPSGIQSLQTDGEKSLYITYDFTDTPSVKELRIEPNVGGYFGALYPISIMNPTKGEYYVDSNNLCWGYYITTVYEDHSEVINVNFGML